MDGKLTELEMTTKVCTGCGLEKDISEFSWSIHGIKMHPRCKSCRSKERSERYERNKEAELAYKWDRQQRKREEARAFVEEYKRNHPCMDCRTTDTMVLSFDHVRGKKKMDISQMVNQGYSLEAIQAEIEKCEVVCLNCHYKREKIRRGTKYV
jgi:hypothetical protein